LTTWPATYIAENAPRNVAGLAEVVVPYLLVADHPAITALRAQYRRRCITTVEMTGVGFFVNYAVPDDAPAAVPRDFAGGNAEIHIAGLEYPAGCVLFVRDGKLRTCSRFISSTTTGQRMTRCLALRGSFRFFLRPKTNQPETEIG